MKSEPILVNDRSVSIRAACPPVPAVVQAGPGGISIRAKWDSCEGIAEPVELYGFVHPVVCIRLTGTLKNGKAPAREFTAMMPQCETPPHDEFEAAIGDAMSQVNDPWGNADDFIRVFLITQSKLGCALSDQDLQPPRNAH